MKKKYTCIVWLIFSFLLIGNLFFAKSFRKAYHWNNGINIVLGTEAIPTKTNPIFVHDSLYIPLDFIEMYIDPTIFWDQERDKVIITSEDKVIRMETEKLDYYVNDQPFNLNFPVHKNEQGLFMSASDMEAIYQLIIEYGKKNKIVSIHQLKHGLMEARLVKKAVLKADKSNMRGIKKLKKNEMLSFVESHEEWVKVITKDFLVGYIHQNNLADVRVTVKKETEKFQKIPFVPDKGKITMVWDLIENFSANYKGFENKKNIHSLDVISPTWFRISDDLGTVSNLADREYVHWAHSQKIQVWALFKNDFQDRETTHDVLSDTNKREYLIKQIIAYAQLYQLDGINIDFEELDKKTGPYFIQFMRELAPIMKEQQLILSVDVYVPYPHTQHYNRKELGKLVDYFMIMAYDQHWSSSPIAGPVAALNWVETGIQNTIKQGVPANKIIVSLPFYNRVWSEKNGKVNSFAVGLPRAEEILKNNRAKKTWIEDIGSYYSEFTKDDLPYKIWLEDHRSLQKKIELVEKYELAGISGWRLGLEHENSFSLYETFKN